mmetsp:Transcript_55155/g.117206  ORF Transcript_55155/g.117206 Transcript_55155/m.117206 type:complete len:260 (+) Transcript_55155:1877-2656(+)
MVHHVQAQPDIVDPPVLQSLNVEPKESVIPQVLVHHYEPIVVVLVRLLFLDVSVVGGGESKSGGVVLEGRGVGRRGSSEGDHGGRRSGDSPVRWSGRGGGGAGRGRRRLVGDGGGGRDLAIGRSMGGGRLEPGYRPRRRRRALQDRGGLRRPAGGTRRRRGRAAIDHARPVAYAEPQVEQRPIGTYVYVSVDPARLAMVELGAVLEGDVPRHLVRAELEPAEIGLGGPVAYSHVGVEDEPRGAIRDGARHSAVLAEDET